MSSEGTMLKVGTTFHMEVFAKNLKKMSRNVRKGDVERNAIIWKKSSLSNPFAHTLSNKVLLV